MFMAGGGWEGDDILDNGFFGVVLVLSIPFIKLGG